MDTEYNFILFWLVTLNLTRILTVLNLYTETIAEFIQYLSNPVDHADEQVLLRTSLFLFL